MFCLVLSSREFEPNEKESGEKKERKYFLVLYFIFISLYINIILFFHFVFFVTKKLY